jgi:hypothetical protein
MTSRRRGAVAAAALLVATTACGGSATRARTDAAPVHVAVAVDPQALVHPGAPLGDGVTVRAGSELVGRAFPWSVPKPGAAVGWTLGWQALLVVTGDPLEVWDGYARALGLGAEADAARSCTVSVVDVSPSGSAAAATTTSMAGSQLARRERFLTEEPLRGENRLRCTARIRGVVMEMAWGLDRACPIHTDGSWQCSSWKVDHLFLQRGPDGSRGSRSLGTDSLSWERGGMGVPAGEVRAPTFVLDDLRGRSTLPGPGDRLDASLDDFLSHTADLAIVPPGARSLVAPAIVVASTAGSSRCSGSAAARRRWTTASTAGSARTTRCCDDEAGPATAGGRPVPSPRPAATSSTRWRSRTRTAPATCS